MREKGQPRALEEQEAKLGVLRFLLLINENWTIIGCGFPISSTGNLDERAKVELCSRDPPLRSSGTLSNVFHCSDPFTFLQL